MSMADQARSIADDAKQLGALVGDAVEQLGKLIQNETQLAKAELAEKAAQAGRGIAMLIAAGLLLIPVLVMLLMTFALWLETFGLSSVTAHLLATGLGARVSVVLGMIGKSKLDADRLSPKVTARELRADMQLAKELGR